MKINLILFLLITFCSTLHSEEQSTQFQQTGSRQIVDAPYVGMGIGIGYGMGMSMGWPGVGGSGGYKGPEPLKIQVADIPNIKINIGEDKAVSCKLENESKNYFCNNGGKPILVKLNTFGFTAIGKDSKNSVITPIISQVEAGGKIIYVAPAYTEVIGYGAPIVPNDPESLGLDNSSKIMAINSFFEYGGVPEGKEKRNNAPSAYQQLVDSFMEEKSQIEKTYSEPNYVVELEDGKKINCARGSRRQLPPQYKEIEEKMGDRVKCGSFKCDPVNVDGKDYEATMLYDSNLGSNYSSSLHLIGKDGIGPSVKIKRIISPHTSTRLIDNSKYSALTDKSYKGDNESWMYPESLKQDREKIISYKTSDFDQMTKYFQLVCNDDNKVLSTLVEAKKKLIGKLGDLKLAEFIQVLGDGSLVGQLIDPILAAQSGCLYQGVYLDAGAAANIERIKKNIHPDSHVDQTISLDRATELFNKAVNMDDIAWKYKRDGCYARAHLMARRFEEEGVRVDKVWIKGDLFIPDTDPLIQWNFHVAPIVYVDDGKGNVQKMVIDPSLFSKPVTVEEWDNKMSKKTARGSAITAFPFPENSALMERSSLSFSSSDPYLPRDSIYMAEEEKMKQANQTMKLYKSVEPKE